MVPSARLAPLRLCASARTFLSGFPGEVLAEALKRKERREFIAGWGPGLVNSGFDSHGPGTQSSAERYQVVVHVTADMLAADEDGHCELDSGLTMSPGQPLRPWVGVVGLDLEKTISNRVVISWFISR